MLTFQRNTYQLALVTDEVDTYAIYNYYNITWIGGTRQGCDPNSGKASTGNPDCEPAQVTMTSFTTLVIFNLKAQVKSSKSFTVCTFTKPVNQSYFSKKKIFE